MHALYRPPTTRSESIVVALAAIACRDFDVPATYVAAPITGGKRFVEWFAQRGASLRDDSLEYRDALRRDVVEPNQIAARKALESLRLASNGWSLIDPSRLDVPGWSQDDYRHFWSCVIERFAARSIFLDGWEYSAGCIYEFLTCSTCRVPMFSQDFQPLRLAVGVERAQCGVGELRRVGASTPFLEDVLKRLQTLARKGA